MHRSVLEEWREESERREGTEEGLFFDFPRGNRGFGRCRNIESENLELLPRICVRNSMASN